MVKIEFFPESDTFTPETKTTKNRRQIYHLCLSEDPLLVIKTHFHWTGLDWTEKTHLIIFTLQELVLKYTQDFGAIKVADSVGIDDLIKENM